MIRRLINIYSEQIHRKWWPLNQTQNAKNTQRLTGSAIYRTHFSATSFHFSQPNSPSPQQYCRLGGSRSGLFSKKTVLDFEDIKRQNQDNVAESNDDLYTFCMESLCSPQTHTCEEIKTSILQPFCCGSNLCPYMDFLCNRASPRRTQTLPLR